MFKDHLSGIGLIAQERGRQIHQEGWTPEHDAEHKRGELAQAAAYYCHPCCDFKESALELFPPTWDQNYAKRQGFPMPTMRDLVKAGGLIVAEIDRRLAAGEEA